MSSSASAMSSQPEKWANNRNNCAPNNWWLPRGEEKSGSISLITSTVLPGAKKWRATLMRLVHAVACFERMSSPTNLTNTVKTVRQWHRELQLLWQSNGVWKAYTCSREQGRWRAVIGAKSFPMEREWSINVNKCSPYRPTILRSRFKAFVRTTAHRNWVGKSMSTIVHALKSTLHTFESSSGVASWRSRR